MALVSDVSRLGSGPRSEMPGFGGKAPLLTTVMFYCKGPPLTKSYVTHREGNVARIPRGRFIKEYTVCAFEFCFSS